MANDVMKVFEMSICDKDLDDGFVLSGDYLEPANAVNRRKNDYAITQDKIGSSVYVNFFVAFTGDRSFDSFFLKSNLKHAVFSYLSGTGATQIDHIIGKTDGTETTCTVTINGDDFIWVIPATANMAPEYQNLINLINAGAQPVTADFVIPLIPSVGIKITADSAGVAFTASITGETGTIEHYNFQSIEQYTDFFEKNDSNEIIQETLLSEITTTKIKITANETIGTDEEKKIYLVELTTKLCQIDIETIGIEKSWQRTNFTNVFGGSIQVVKYANHAKVAIDLSFENLTGDNFLAYALIKSYSVIAPLNVYLYLSDTYELLNEQSWHLVNDISDYDGSPTGEALTQGCSGGLKLREC